MKSNEREMMLDAIGQNVWEEAEAHSKRKKMVSVMATDRVRIGFQVAEGRAEALQSALDGAEGLLTSKAVETISRLQEASEALPQTLKSFFENTRQNRLMNSEVLEIVLKNVEAHQDKNAHGVMGRFFGTHLHQSKMDVSQILKETEASLDRLANKAPVSFTAETLSKNLTATSSSGYHVLDTLKALEKQVDLGPLQSATYVHAIKNEAKTRRQAEKTLND